MTKLHRRTPSQAQVGDLVAYLESLPPPTAKQIPGADWERARQGRDLFEGKARCARCHCGETLQDGERHDVGYGGPFRTPSLRGVSDRAPLLHDGRALGIEDIFLRHNESKRHGAAHDLSDDEMACLVLYVKSL